LRRPWLRAVAALELATEVTGDSKTDTINRAIQIYAYLEHIASKGGTLHRWGRRGKTHRVRTGLWPWDRRWWLEIQARTWPYASGQRSESLPVVYGTPASRLLARAASALLSRRPQGGCQRLLPPGKLSRDPGREVQVGSHLADKLADHVSRSDVLALRVPSQETVQVRSQVDSNPDLPLLSCGSACQFGLQFRCCCRRLSNCLRHALRGMGSGLFRGAGLLRRAHELFDSASSFSCALRPASVRHLAEAPVRLINQHCKPYPPISP
jgi:hypothetical protein